MNRQKEKPETERYKLVSEPPASIQNLIPYLGRGLLEDSYAALTAHVCAPSKLAKVYHLERTTIGLLLGEDYQVAISGTSDDRKNIIKVLEFLCNNDSSRRTGTHPTIKLEKVQ